jgi:D-inositol-3-phosphate glycosyltransferase
LKILLIGPASPLRGGIANFNDSLFTALENEHEVHIVSFSLQYPSILFPGKTQYETGARHISVRSRQLINTINPFSWYTAASEIIKLNPDCILVHYWMPFFAPALGTIIRRVKKVIKVKVIGIIHNLNPHERIPAGKLLSHFFLKSCHGFITMSSTVGQELAEAGIKGPVKMIPHPVYDIFGKSVSRQFAYDFLGLEKSRLHLLFFGIIRNYKGLDLLLRALASPRLSNLDIKLLVAGEFYENEKKYLDMVEELGIENKIMFTNNFVPREEVAHYFAVADLVVLPYLSATQSGIVQVAYHFEKPVLVTDVGGLKEVVPHGKVGYVCEKDPEVIAECIADFFNNERSEEFIMNIKTEKKRFSWESMVSGIEDLTGDLSESFE